MGRKRPTTREQGLSGAWRQVRLAVLARDGYRCAVCGGRADAVDHIVPRSAGGPRLDPRNLRAICRACNSRKGNGTKRHATRPWLAKRYASGPGRVWPGAIHGPKG